MKRILKFLDNNFWIFILLLPIPSILSLFIKPGYFGASDDMHIAWLYEMDRVLKAGKIPPRYVPDLSFGFGYPLFNFVFPLPFYIAEIFHLFGFSLVDSIKLVLAISLFSSFLFMYLLLRKFADKFVSLLGALVYLYAPYRATDVYVRGAIGESLAFVFLPLIFLSFISLIDSNRSKKNNWKWMSIGSFSIAGLILSHNIVAYMFLPLFALLFLSLFLSGLSREKILPILLSFLGGFLLSSYFWVPALLDSRLMKYDTVFNYFDHFPTLKQLITPYFGYGASVPGPYDGMSFFIGLPQILIFLIALVLYFLSYKKLSVIKNVFIGWSFFVFLSSIFMMNHRSSFVWSILPLIGYFQFPWRFLTMVVFTTSLLTVVIERLRYKNIFVFLLSLICLYYGFSYFKPSEYLGRRDDYYINRYIPVPIPSEDYKNTSEEYLRLPVSNKARPNEVVPLLFGSNFLVDSLNEINFLDFRVSVNVIVDEGTMISARRYVFPGWIVKLDGKRIDYNIGEPFGQISFFVPKGKHEVEVIFEEERRNRILDLISFTTVIVLVYFLFSKRHE